MIPIIYLIFILESCHALHEFDSRPRNFSMELLNATGFDNVVIAPFNLWCLLAGVGLWTSGESQEQISQTLKLPKNKTLFLNEFLNLKQTVFDEKNNYRSINNAILVYTRTNFYILPEFREIMTTYFGAVIETLNFEDNEEAVKKAHDVVKTTFKKAGILRTFFRPEDFRNTTMIMSSVTLFNGYWKSTFNFSHTYEETFSVFNSPDIYFVKMMNQWMMLPYSNMDSLNADVMELAIGHEDKYCLLLILPHPRTEIREVYQKLYKVTLKDIFDKLQSDVNKFGMREVNLTLPRVKIETSIILNKPLIDIRLKDVFESEKSNFLGIARDDIYISSIDHTCEMFIIETGVYITSSIPGHYDHKIRTSDLPAKQPFIFFVMEKTTQTVLFGGFYTKASPSMNDWPT